MFEFKSVSFIDKGKKILDNVSFVVKNSDFLVITGPNGSGKSTIANLIMGVIKPSNGKIYFNGTDITDFSITDRAKLGISYAFQQPITIKGISVKDLIGISDESSSLIASKFLKIVGLEPEAYLDRELNHSLSGGELKRIELASVLARKTDLTVFDEPEAGIDLWSFDNLIKIFGKLQKTGKISIVISHQEKIIDKATKLMILKNGKVSYFGPNDKTVLGGEDD